MERQPPRLEDIPEDITSREVAYELRLSRYEDAPMREFYRSALVVLSILKWTGPAGIGIMLVILAVLGSHAFGV